MIVGSAHAPTDRCFSVTVDYDLPLRKMIEAGHYDEKNPRINAVNFAVTRHGRINLDITVLDFNYAVEFREVLMEMEKRGIRTAELHELLAFVAQYPLERQRFGVVALGSLWRDDDGDCRAPSLY